MNDIDNGGAPFDPNSTAETSFGDQKQISNMAASAAKKLLERSANLDREDDTLVQFVSPTFPNSKYLVKAGTVVTRVHQGGGSYMEGRTEDIWAKFASGILTTDEPEVIEWCVAHSGDKEMHEAYHESVKAARACGVPVGLCRPEGPGVGMWAKLKELSIATSGHDVQIPPEINVDELLKNFQPTPGTEAMGNDMRERAKANLDAARRRNEA